MRKQGKQTRREFLSVATGAGVVAVAVVGGRGGLTSTADQWQWVKPGEVYDPDYDYVYDDGTPVEWEWVDVNDQWVWVEPGEPYGSDYEYVYEDGAAVGEEYWEVV